MSGAYDGFADPGEQLLLELEFTPPPGVVRRYPLKRTLQDLVLEFHETFGCVIDSRSWADLKFRRALIQEEFDELMVELDQAIGTIALDDSETVSNLEKIAKEASDLIYVVLGAGVTLGLDIDKAVRLVHASNMSKTGADGTPQYREDGKVLKGPNYFEPDMTSCVKEL